MRSLLPNVTKTLFLAIKLQLRHLNYKDQFFTQSMIYSWQDYCQNQCVKVVFLVTAYSLQNNSALKAKTFKCD